jgi:DNA-directed RNA polymerase subunit L
VVKYRGRIGRPEASTRNFREEAPIWVVQHSPGYRHTLNYVLHQRIGGTVGVDFQYWILHPLHTRTNLTS